MTFCYPIVNYQGKSRQARGERRNPMDVSFVIRRRLEELGLGQKGLARAARVTESYVSQLLTRKKAPPAPNRTDIYEKMDRFLELPTGELARVADAQRKEQLKRVPKSG
jgi:transcriptional regulator with XRE-family HTH domain